MRAEKCVVGAVVLLLGVVGCRGGASVPDEPVSGGGEVGERRAQALRAIPGRGDEAGPMRAMWVWDGSNGRRILDDEAGAREAFLAFLEAPHGQPERAIDRIFFEARNYGAAGPVGSNKKGSLRSPDPRDPLKEPSGRRALRALLEQLHERDVQVEYLDGDALWVTRDDYAERAVQVCEDVVAFNRGAVEAEGPAGRFDGIHFDIEPHVLTAEKGEERGVKGTWRVEGGYNSEWIGRWMEILERCDAEIEAYREENGHAMSLSTDVGPDYHHYVTALRDALNTRQGPLDYVTVMNYLDAGENAAGERRFFDGEVVDVEDGDGDAETRAGGVAPNLRDWDALPVVVGLETSPCVAPEITFADEGYRAMHRVLDAAVEEYGRQGLAGVAVHHYGPLGYRAMRAEGCEACRARCRGGS